MDDSCNFLSLVAFQNKYNLIARSLTFLGIISATKLLKRHISQNTIPLKNESFLSKFLASSKPSRIVYKKLVSKKGELPKSSQQKWREDVVFAPKQEINWKAAYQLSFQCTKSSKLIAFNFKFLHRRLSTNNFLKKIGFVDSEKCTFCQGEIEKLIHLFWDCPKTQSFWISLNSWLEICQVIVKEKPLQPDTALGLKPDSSKYKLQINFCCLNAKYYIWLCRLKECDPKLNNFLRYLRYIQELENNSNTTASQKKWEPLEPFL